MSSGIGKIAMIVGGVIAAVSFIPITLGFSTAGIVGGSVAAAIQSMIGAVSSGSIFATMTSLGMTGVFSKLVAVGTLFAGIGLTSLFRKR